MAWWKRIFNRRTQRPLRVELITDQGDFFHSFNGSIYQSDVVRSAIRPKVKAIGKLAAMHVRESAGRMEIDPEPYMRMLLDDPNPYSSGQMFLERMAGLLAINNNAFARIFWDESGIIPEQMYVIPAVAAEAIRDDRREILLRFQLLRGGVMTVPYRDVIHLRDDYLENDVFGEEKSKALQALLEVINKSDQSIVNAVQKSAVVRWLMKIRAQLNPEDKRRLVDEFARDYLAAEAAGGVVPSDPRAELEPVKQMPFVPRSPDQERAIQRIHSFFGVNQKIVDSTYDENEWISYYEAEIEPLAQQMSAEFSRKLFTRRERGFGNRIVFGGQNLAHASMSTKLSLVQMVDRGAMTPNEWRRIMNLPPIDGGDVPIRRLDTAEVDGDNSRNDEPNAVPEEE